ncbi:hypothetical protein [Arthrobacter sp. JCM 19049]|nr:hypothetical protein [Arthrobacter sp. JCM 19049]
MRVIAGLLQPQSGRVMIQARSSAHRTPSRGRRRATRCRWCSRTRSAR